MSSKLELATGMLAQHIQKTRVASIGEVWQQLNKLLNLTRLGNMSTATSAAELLICHEVFWT
jgi:hypothetical protein